MEEDDFARDIAEPLSGRKGKEPTLAKKLSVRKIIAQQTKMEKMKSLSHFKGKKLLEVCSNAKAIFNIADKHVEAWGLIYYPNEGL